MCAPHCCASLTLALLKKTSVTHFLRLLIPIHVRKKIQSHIEAVKNDIWCNFKEITICPDSTYLPIPAIAMYAWNCHTWDNDQPRHVYINSNVTDSTWCTYNNNPLLYVNTESITSKPWGTYHVNLQQHYRFHCTLPNLMYLWWQMSSPCHYRFHCATNIFFPLIVTDISWLGTSTLAWISN